MNIVYKLKEVLKIKKSFKDMIESFGGKSTDDFSIYKEELYRYFVEGDFSSYNDGGTVIIPDDITGIKNSAFSQANIKSITLSENVNSIGNYAFDNCGMIKEINLPNNLSLIGEGAFF